MFAAGVAHPVERHLAKVEVASSSLVTRSMKTVSERKRSSFLLLAISNGLVCIFAEGENRGAGLGWTSLSKITKKAAAPKGNCFFGDLERTRTVDLQRDRLAC